MLDKITGFSDPKACDTLEKAWKVSGSEYEMYRYDGVGHSFMDDEPTGEFRPIHDPETAKLAWSRTCMFLKKHGI